jgi:uncharacterized protein (TIGR02646 family)
MPIREWDLSELVRLSELTSGKASDWDKQSLKTLKDKLRRELIEYQNYSCAYCRREITMEIGRSELDHVIPSSLAPTFTFVRANLTLTCKRCNHRKKDYNPTVFASNALKYIRGYLVDQDEYIWIHPYIHNYEDHIRVVGGSLFESVNDSDKGLAVISECKLNELAQVVDIQKTAMISRSKSPMEAIFKMLGEYPEDDAESLSERLHRKFPSTPHAVFLEKIRKLRSDNPMDALSLI